MVNLLVDVHKSEGLMDIQNNTLTSAQKRDVMSTVLAQHNVTKERYDSSLIWYANNLKLLIRVYSHVDEELVKQYDYWSEEIGKIRDFGISEAGDTVELWTQPMYQILDKRRNTQARTWNLTPDSNYIASDMLTWHMRVLNMNEGQTLVAAIAMDGGMDNNNRKAPIVSVQKMIGYRQFCNDTTEIIIQVAAPNSTKDFPNAKLNLTLVTDTVVNRHHSPVFIDQLSLMRIHQ